MYQAFDGNAIGVKVDFEEAVELAAHFEFDGIYLNVPYLMANGPETVVQMLEEASRKSAQWLVMTEGPAKPFDVLPPLPAASPVLTTSKGTLIPVTEIDYSHAGAGAVLPNCSYACKRVALDEPSR